MLLVSAFQEKVLDELLVDRSVHVWEGLSDCLVERLLRVQLVREASLALRVEGRGELSHQFGGGVLCRSLLRR